MAGSNANLSERNAADQLSGSIWINRRFSVPKVVGDGYCVWSVLHLPEADDLTVRSSIHRRQGALKTIE